MSYFQIRGIRRREAIIEYLQAEKDAGHPVPTVREIAAQVGCSSTTVYQHLQVMQESGRIERRPHIARSIRVA